MSNEWKVRRVDRQFGRCSPNLTYLFKLSSLIFYTERHFFAKPFRSINNYISTEPLAKLLSHYSKTITYEYIMAKKLLIYSCTSEFCKYLIIVTAFSNDFYKVSPHGKTVINKRFKRFWRPVSPHGIQGFLVHSQQVSRLA